MNRDTIGCAVPGAKGKAVRWQAFSECARSTLPNSVQAHLEACGAEWERLFPKRLGTRAEVAAHEVGHAVVCEATGYGFVEAEMHRATTERMNERIWVGTCSPSFRYNDIEIITPECVLAESAIILGGAVGGLLIANVSPLNHPFEVMNAASFALKYAKMHSVAFEVGWSAVVSYTVRIVNFHRRDIQTLAHRLARFERISHTDRKVARVLRRFQATPGRTVPPAPQEEQAFMQHLAAAPIALGSFAHEVSRLAAREARA